jgi:hypothetical protein
VPKTNRAGSRASLAANRDRLAVEFADLVRRNCRDVDQRKRASTDDSSLPLSPYLPSR